MNNIEDWELEAYADGAADARLDALIAQSPELAARIEMIKRGNSVLRISLHRADCPSEDDLRLYQSGFLPRSHAEEIERHLAECLTCTSEVAAYARLDARPTLSDALGHVKQSIEVFLAQLLHAESPSPALRGTEGEDSTTAIYNVPQRNWQIGLTQSADELGYKLSGQLNTHDNSPLTQAFATLLRNTELADETYDQPALETPIDTVGWFVFHDLEPGSYALWLEVGEAKVEIAAIKIGPSNS